MTDTDVYVGDETGEEPTPKRRGRRPGPMTDEQKIAMAVGRRQSAIVQRYLAALTASKTGGGRGRGRGRRRSPEQIEDFLRTVAEKIDRAKAEGQFVDALELINQQALDQKRLEALAGTDGDLPTLEEDFIAVAADYSERRKILYSSWRQLGVPARVLKAAGITRGGVAADEDDDDEEPAPGDEEAVATEFVAGSEDDEDDADEEDLEYDEDASDEEVASAPRIISDEEDDVEYEDEDATV